MQSISTDSLIDEELSSRASEFVFSNQSTNLEVEPTPMELVTLERVCDRIPLTAWYLIFCELCEGFASYGTYQLMQNYIQFPPRSSENHQPGALNLGQNIATTMTTSYFLFANFASIPIALITEQFWGRYKTIIISCLIYSVGLILLVLTSIPASITAGVALPGLICSMIILGIAQGGYKCTIGPFMAEQYTRATPVVIG